MGRCGNAHEPLTRSAWKKGWGDTDATAIGEVIAELERVDRDSMAARYPVDKSNSAFARPTQLVNFSVTAFMAAFLHGTDFLSAGNLWIEVGLRLKTEGRRHRSPLTA